MKLRVTGWHDYQHYKDRAPPWIKLHNTLLTSEFWVMGDDASRTLAIVCMLLASRSKDGDGTFNADPKYVQRYGYLNQDPDFKPLIQYGFLEVVQDASTTLAPCNTEKRRGETETEKEGKATALLVPSHSAGDLLDANADEKLRKAAGGEKTPATPDDCPHGQIVALYHELLPECPPVKTWHATRAALLRQRWREDQKRQTLDWWRRYFGYVRESDFLVGKASAHNGRPPFVADLEWLIRPTNLAKVIEGKYHHDGVTA